jgi:hypothetical protein
MNFGQHYQHVGRDSYCEPPLYEAKVIAIKLTFLKLFLCKAVVEQQRSLQEPVNCVSQGTLRIQVTHLFSLYTVISKPALYKLLTFHVPNLIPIYRSLGRLPKESGQVRGWCKIFVTCLFS